MIISLLNIDRYSSLEIMFNHILETLKGKNSNSLELMRKISQISSIEQASDRLQLITSVCVLVGGVVSPDSEFILDILIQVVELLHVVLFQRGAVVGDVHYVEEAVFLHGLEEEGVNVGVVVEKILVGDLRYTIEYVFILFRPQPAIILHLQ